MQHYTSKSRPINITLPKVDSIDSAHQAQAEVVEAVAAGELLTDQGQVLSNLIENQRRSLETQHLEQRLKAIEEKLGVKI